MQVSTSNEQIDPIDPIDPMRHYPGDTTSSLINQGEWGLAPTPFDHTSLPVLNDLVIFENYSVINFLHIKPAGKKPTVDLTINIMQRFIVASSLEAIGITNGVYNFRSCQSLT